ncbi:MAG: S-layer protein [Candidatus Micrarchaeota archaeon]|nr:S-layer protein [Candidatus Micrarchaeota archaeon]
MKVNLKKLGAIVAGATILASSVAYAGLMFGSTELVNANGAPVAKVVVGESAAASDGVAAANIAAKLASEAFKTSTLTAQVAGLDSVSCALGSASGGATCAVSDKQVKLEVTVPGATDTSVYQFESLIGETVDRTTLDRTKQATTGTSSDYHIATAESSPDSNPFANGDGGNIGRSALSVYKIDGGIYSAFKDVTILDKDSGKTFKEEQKVFVKAETSYKSQDSAVDARVRELVYQIKFTQDSYGMPVCDTSVNASWANCAQTDTHNLGTHKIKIRFLGDDWVITKLDQSGASTVINETHVQNGGTVELSKESVGGIINVGDSLDAGNGYKITLDDIKSGTSSAEQSAIVSLVDANGQVVKQTTISPGSTQTLTTTAGGAQILVRVFKTAPGYTFGAKWADMSVLSNQITLKDADSTVEVNGDRSSNDPWSVALGWRNRDTGQDNTTDHLRTIVLYRDTDSDWLTAGNGIKMLENPIGYTLLYKGLNLDKTSSDDYDTLRYSEGDGTFSFKPDGSTTSVTVNSVSYVDITSTVPNAFSGGSGTGSKLKVVFGNMSQLMSSPLNTSGISGGGFPSNGVLHGTIMLQLTSGNWVWVANSTAAAVNPVPDAIHETRGVTNVTYSSAGSSGTASNSNLGGTLFFSFAGNGSLSNRGSAIYAANQIIIGGANFTVPFTNAVDENISYVFGVSEDAGEGTSTNKPEAFAILYDINAKSLNKDFTLTANAASPTYSKDKITWASAQNVSGASTGSSVSDDIYGVGPPTTQQVNFVTERGSIITDRGDSSFTVKMARKPAHAVFVLQPTVAAATTPGAQVFTGTEGDVFDAGKGVKVKVVSLTQTVGSCSVGTGAAPACTSDTAGVSAVIMPDNKASVVAGVPYGYDNFGPLVVLDKDAVGTDVLVTVGGPVVNSVTKDVLAGSTVDFNTDKKVVKEVVAGKKIVVAGLNADDTLEAAKDFISQLKSQ